MTDKIMKQRLSKLTGETDEDILSAFLETAADKILAKCYPFHHDMMAVPARYRSTQLEIAAYLLNKRGAEGQTAHSENGISRSYESADVPPSMLSGVIPHCKAVKL